MEEHHMSEPEPTRIIKTRTKARPGPSLLAAVILATQNRVDPDTLAAILEDATQLMQDFRSLRSKRSPNE